MKRSLNSSEAKTSSALDDLLLGADDFDISSFQLLNENLQKIRKTELSLVDTIREFPESNDFIDNTDSTNTLTNFILSNSFWNEFIAMSKEMIPTNNNNDNNIIIINNNNNNDNNIIIINNNNNININHNNININHNDVTTNVSDDAIDISYIDDNHLSSISYENGIDIFCNVKLTYDNVIDHFKNDAVVITESKSPFRIKYVNECWEKMCGYKFNECIDKTLSIIQGPATDKNILNEVMMDVKKGLNSSARLINYNRNGKMFYNNLSISHLKDESLCIGILKFDGYYNIL